MFKEWKKNRKLRKTNKYLLLSLNQQEKNIRTIYRYLNADLSSDVIVKALQNYMKILITCLDQEEK